MYPKTQLSAIEFQNLIKAGKAEFPVSRKDDQGNLYINNVEVSETISLQEITLKSGITIGSNTSFKRFNIKDGNFEHFTIEGGQFKSTFHISGGSFTKFFSVTGGEFTGEFRISGGQFRSVFRFLGGTFNNHINIAGGNFSNSFFIGGGEFNNVFRVTNGTFEQDFSVSGGTFKSALFMLNGTFNKVFSITGGKFQDFFIIQGGNYNRIDLKGGHFDSEFNVSGGKISNFRIISGTYKNPFKIDKGDFNFFSISGGEFNNTVSIFDGMFKFFYIEGGEFNDRFEILGGEFITGLHIRESKFTDSFSLFGGESKKTFLIDSDTYIHEFNLYKSIGEMVVNGVQIDEISFFNFINKHSLKIMGTQPTKDGDVIKITIYRSSLGNTEIIGCDWSKGILTVDDSKIIDSYYTDTIFPINIKSSEENSIANAKQVRDTYSQLKTIADKQNDRQSSLTFQAKSNEQILLLKKEEIQRSIKWKAFWGIALWKSDWWEWFQLWLSKVSNNFGTSYVRALFMILVVGFISFSIYLPCLVENLEFTWNYKKWGSGFWYGLTNHSGDFLGFLNPARKYNFLSCTGSNCHDQIALAVDWVSRIFIGFFLVGLIQAFRKYGKR